MTPEGRPPGPFAMDAGHGEGPEDGGHRWIEGPRRAREPAAARPDTRVVSVRGREGDLRDILPGADPHGDVLPVRAGRPAKRRVPGPDGGAECLRDHVAAPHAPAVTDLTVPASGGAGGRGERTARPGVRAAEVTVIPPGRATDAEPLSVPATGTGPPEDGGEPPHRPLPTTERPAEGEADAVFAATVLDRYGGRWTMETRFRTPGRGRGSGTAGPSPPMT